MRVLRRAGCQEVGVGYGLDQTSGATSCQEGPRLHREEQPAVPGETVVPCFISWVSSSSAHLPFGK